MASNSSAPLRGRQLRHGQTGPALFLHGHDLVESPGLRHVFNFAEVLAGPEATRFDGAFVLALFPSRIVAFSGQSATARRRL